MRTPRFLATAALAAALVTAPLLTVSADAAVRTHSVVGCDVRHTSCVAVADNDEGRLVMRDAHGHRHALHSSAQALRYLRAHHFRQCAQEDSPACYWSAGTRGNGQGESYIVIGQDSVWYLGNLD